MRHDHRDPAIQVGTHAEPDDAPALTPDELERAREAIAEELRRQPPTLGVVGVSGVGKSSTLNAMFGLSLPTSDTVACTTEFLAIELALTSERGRTEGSAVPLRVVDAPGLGEDVGRDAEYLQMYVDHLPGCDAVLWLTAARSRAVSLDQMYLDVLGEFHDKMVFGVNQIDLVEPLDWSERTNLPSADQQERIDEILADRAQRFEEVVGRPVPIEAFSAKRRFRLQSVFTSLLEAIPDERAWIYADLKAFEYDDFVPAELRDSLDDDGVEPAAVSGRSRWRRDR